MEGPSAAYRVERGKPGFTLQIPYARVPGLDGWFGIKLNGLIVDEPIADSPLRSSGEVGFDLFYTRSAGRMVDWYATIGLSQKILVINEIPIENVNDFATEGGLRLRFPLPDFWKHTLKIPFVGARLGVRTTQFDTLANARLIYEFGLGAW
jgi:hypothetical protein